MADIFSGRWLLAMVLACLTLIGSLITYWPSLVPFSFVETKQENITNITHTTIVLWYWPFDQRASLEGDVCHQLYAIPNCTLVDDRSQFSEADFVVFHNRELINGRQRLPVEFNRPQNQRWVWFSLESPANNGNVRSFGGQFNSTMSYRRDADIYTPYGRLVPYDFGPGMTVEDFIPKEKSSLACWVVSNFQPHHRRSLVYSVLKNYIQVEVYGGAFNKRLSSDVLLPTISRCYFYLAFENSVFKDYITEKFWYNGLMGGAVPVVLGPPRADYEAVVPNNSFIHVDDFNSVKNLAEFLKKLAQDKERYASYFKWKLNHKVEYFEDWRKEFCSICKYSRCLQTRKVYNNFQEWESN